jgi:hypothetical protein
MILEPLQYWKLRALMREQQIAELQAQIALERAKAVYQRRLAFAKELGLQDDSSVTFNDTTFEVTEEG